MLEKILQSRSSICSCRREVVFRVCFHKFDTVLINVETVFVDLLSNIFYSLSCN